MVNTTTSYGSYTLYMKSLSPETDVLNYLNGGDTDWRERVASTGAYDAMCRDYRDAIGAVLPEGLSLVGDEFMGPHPQTDEFREIFDDIEELINTINLGAIVEKHDPDNR